MPAHVRHQLQLSAKGLDVRGKRLEGRDLATLDLRHPPGADPHDLCEPRLGEAQPLPLLSQLITPLLSHDRATPANGFLLADPATVGIPVPLSEAAHWPSSSAATGLPATVGGRAVLDVLNDDRML
jgi:hypothetical protein